MSRPWMPLYVADYLADTAHLSAAESGAYLHLIMHYWQTGGLPQDAKHLARIAKMTPNEWAEHCLSIASFFNDDWTHGRIDRELAVAREKYEKRANAGRKGGKAKPKQKPGSSNAKAGLNQPQLHSSNEEDTSSLRSDVSAGAPSKRSPKRSSDARSELLAVLDAEHAEAVLDHRRKIRRPLTGHAARLLAGKLGSCPDPNAAADAMIANGWQGFEAAWLDKGDRQRGPPMNGQQPRPKTASEKAVDVLESFRTTPRQAPGPEPDSFAGTTIDAGDYRRVG